MIFLDTGFLFAYVSEKDKDHERVNEVLEAHRGQRLADLLLTTNHVVSETITMEKQGIREAWAVDEDFTHAFVARPGPR